MKMNSTQPLEIGVQKQQAIGQAAYCAPTGELIYRNPPFITPIPRESKRIVVESNGVSTLGL
jgi:hypothetical protein